MFFSSERPKKMRCKRETVVPLAIPTISSLSQLSARRVPPYATIYIYGSNFRPWSVVTFGRYVCQSVYNNSGLMGFLIPANPAVMMHPGDYRVRVNNANQTPPPGAVNTNLYSNFVEFEVTA